MDEVFRALADPSRRRPLDSLNQRTGQTLRERGSISTRSCVAWAGWRPRGWWSAAIVAGGCGGRCPGRSRGRGRIHVPGRPHECKIPARWRAGILHSRPAISHPARVTSTVQAHEELVTHLARTSPLSQGEAARVVAEVLGYFGESVDEFVRRRHRELKTGGLTNEQAFARIAAELPARRVAPPQLSLRQLRRVVYG